MKDKFRVGDIVHIKVKGWGTGNYLITERTDKGQFFLRPLLNSIYGTFNECVLERSKPIRYKEVKKLKEKKE